MQGRDDWLADYDDGISPDTKFDFDAPQEASAPRSNYAMSPAVSSKSESFEIPFRVRQSAETLINFEGLRMRDEGDLDQLAMLAQAPDTLCGIDPMLVAHRVIDTSACLIRLYEVLPLSRYLMLCALRATYRLKVTPASREMPMPWKKIPLKAYCGDGSEGVRGQPMDSETCLLDAIDAASDLRDDFVFQVNGWMKLQGSLDPRAVCMPDALQRLLDEVERISANEYTPIPPQKRLKLE